MAGDNKSFDEVMESITSGFVGDWETDRSYLVKQMEIYKEHPFSREILRACGRLLYSMMPEDKRQEIGQVIDNHRSAAEATLEEVAFNIKQGEWGRALELIEPLAEKMDELVASGWSSDDSKNRYFDFRNVIDEFVWRAHNDEERVIRPAAEPFAKVYLTYGSCLFEAQRYDDAIVACGKAIRWNPADVGLRFELGENYKRLGDMDSYEQVLRDLHPYIATANDLAHYHRAMGYYCIEQRHLRIAAAHLLTSLLFENSNLPLSEVMYIKMECGEDYTDMTPQDAIAVLSDAGEVIFHDAETHRALAELIRVSFQHKDYEVTLHTAVELYNITRGEEYERIAQQVMDLLEANGGNPKGE